MPTQTADLGAVYQELTTAVDRWWESLAHDEEGAGVDGYLAHQATRYARFLAEELHAHCERNLGEPCLLRLDGIITASLEKLRRLFDEQLILQYAGDSTPLIRAHAPEVEHALLSIFDLAARQTTTRIRVRLQLGMWSEVRSSAEGLGAHRHVALAVTCAGPRWAHPFDSVEDNTRLRPALEVVRATLERQAGALLTQGDYAWGNHLTLVWPVAV